MRPSLEQVAIQVKLLYSYSGTARDKVTGTRRNFAAMVFLTRTSAENRSSSLWLCHQGATRYATNPGRSEIVVRIACGPGSSLSEAAMVVISGR